MNIYIDYKIKNIQELRAIQAIAETDINIIIPSKQESKFSLLKQKFQMDFNVSEEKDGAKLAELLFLNHEKPETNILTIKKPLIFPIEIPNYCKSLWKEERAYKYTFAGLINKSRHSLIKNWIKNNITKERVKLPVTETYFNKKKSKFYAFFNRYKSVAKSIGDLTVWSSYKGRRFPIKAWDDDYFKVLGNSEFVLCPSGFCVWSYRFFESILCGAIPIVEDNYEAYEGFKFKLMSDDASTFIWSKADAEYNYNLCIERITVSPNLLEEVLSQSKYNKE